MPDLDFGGSALLKAEQQLLEALHAAAFERVEMANGQAEGLLPTHVQLWCYDFDIFINQMLVVASKLLRPRAPRCSLLSKAKQTPRGGGRLQPVQIFGQSSPSQTGGGG